MTSKRGRKKNADNNKSVMSLREMLKKDVGSSEKPPLSGTKKKTTSRGDSTSNERRINVDIPQNLPIPNIQIHNEINDLAANDGKRKNQKSYKKKNQDDDGHLDKGGHIDLTQCEEELDIPDQASSNRRQRKSVNFKNLKQLPVLLDIPIQNNSMSSATSATSFQRTEKTTTEASIKRKKFDEFSDLPTKHIKFNANIQSILEKILEEQLKQRATIEVLEENNTELKREVLENRKLIQNKICFH